MAGEVLVTLRQTFLDGRSARDAAVPLPRTLALAFVLTASVLCGASPATARETVVSSPSTPSRVLRALGLETPPGVRGDKAYRNGDYEEALRQYGKAVDETAPGAPERRLLDLNIGNALYRQQRWPEAADAYGQALKGSGNDSGFATQAHHNLGNAFYRKAEAAQAGNEAQPDAAIADLREAVAHYKKALRMDARGTRTKQNLEQATALLQQLLEQQQQQQQQQQDNQKQPPPSARAKEALARALQLAQERRYDEATTVLTDIMRRDRTASSFSAHLKRLEDVRKIMRGEKPAAMVPGAPGAAGGRVP